MLKTLPMLAAAILGAAALSGCALPQTTVRTGSATPSLAVAGAPDGAVLYVDGISAGAASQYNGRPKVLAVLEGVHQVELRQGSTVVYSEKAFVSSGETHTVTVGAGASR